LVIPGLAFPDDPCGNAIGYCGTISCIAGNIYYQGYVFMSVVLSINAYICLRSLSLSTEIEDIEKEIEHPPGNEDYKDLLHVEEPVKAHQEIGYIYDADTKEICSCLSKRPIDVISPYLDGNIILRSFIRFGVILTTFTGILPDVAYDDPQATPLAVLSDNLHLFGIVSGIAIILFMLALRVLSRFLTDCCSSQNTHKNPSEVIMTRVEYILDFILVLILMALLIYFAISRGPRLPRSWFCLDHQNQIECMASDRNLSSLLQPWPCVWGVTNSIAECTNPQCPWEKNAQGVVVEFFVLNYVIVLIASYLSSFAGPLSQIAPSERKCSCT